MDQISRNASTAQVFFYRLMDAWNECDIPYDIAVVLAGAGVSREQVAQGQVYMRDYFRAVEVAAPMTADTGLFLRVGRSLSLFDLGIVGYALYSAPNLRSSWDMSLGQSIGLVPHPVTITRHESEEYAGVVLHPPETELDTRQAFCEEWLFGTWRWMCQRLPELTDCHDAMLDLAYAAPNYRQLYTESFPGKVRFEMPRTALWVPHEYYEKPFESANALIMRLCHQKGLVDVVQSDSKEDLAADIRLYLLKNARTPFPTLEQTARAFRMPPYTLHRRLARQNTTFRHLKLTVRMTLARHYLKETNMPLQVISDVLGYGEPASFVRAFKRWYGVTPMAFREN